MAATIEYKNRTGGTSVLSPLGCSFLFFFLVPFIVVVSIVSICLV